MFFDLNFVSMYCRDNFRSLVLVYLTVFTYIFLVGLFVLCSHLSYYCFYV